VIDGGGSTTALNGRFRTFVGLVLSWEGAPTDDPHDLGGPTVHGIARASHPDIPWPPSLAQALALYRDEYYAPIRAGELPAPLAIVAFDAAVVHGLGWATRALQRVLGVTADGVIGPKTLAAAYRSGPAAVDALCADRLSEFERSVQEHLANARYAEGWRLRALKCHREAVRFEVTG
jgi:lysozyme family protein